ncbi:MAG TPA: noncanonical pyrimidine nucleotidase, YjjG family [Cryomorphaceae bacterium]|nr:noncanonical pyrimidine nucleotidase, YjjG family [Cryomorphaceae bacterium]|tara:strand:+ start:1986 stop:2684 length:699 start_codon:yes stop_codon:yes gene_type:complete
MSYKHLFFDWDHTLWDFEKNSEQSLRKLFKDLDLVGLGIPSFEEFYPLYLVVNEQKWMLYRKGEIDKANLRASRFRETFVHFGVVADETAWTLEQRYIEETPYGQHLIEGTKETLETLAQRGYKMHIITNGFTESQTIKFTESGLKHYFDLLLCSDEVGVNKPEPKIFRAALSRTRAKRKESLMIGDNLIADCIGARNQGIDQVFFNPRSLRHSEKFTFEITRIPELLDFLK